MGNAILRAMLLLLLGGMVVWLGGCQSGPVVDARELAPMVDADGRPRSLAFASPQQREVVAEANLPPGLPWFAERNDQYPSVEAGFQTEIVERSATVTVDRQRVIRGRVYDDYRETTYRQRVRESWR
ncbi:MAG: hypothetical protein WD118_05865 [Phycisphaeraceae bacterium]